MLIYLDSAQFDALERAKAGERESFLRTWNDANCELALSLHHLQEIGQVADAESLERRVQVLDSFPVVRCLPASSDTVLRFEIRELLRGRSIDRMEGRKQFFPVQSIAELQEFIAANQGIFHGFSDAYTTGAEAERLSKQTRVQGPSKIPSDVDWDALYHSSREEMLRHSTAMPEIKELMEGMFEKMFALLRDHGSRRGAVESAYGLQDVLNIRDVPDDDLSLAHVFYSAAREEAVALARETMGDAHQLLSRVPEISLYDCPGYHLKLTAHRARRPHPKEPEPGDQVDEDHVTFAPYVDLLIVDKRTLGFLTQRVKNRSLIMLEPEVANIRRVIDLRQCQEFIATLANG